MSETAASSVASDPAVDLPWINLRGTTVHNTKAYIFSKDFDKSKYENFYIYGDGPKGRGYYSKQTKEAYRMFLKKLKRKKLMHHRNATAGDGMGCLSCLAPTLPVTEATLRYVEYEKQKERDTKELIEAIQKHVLQGRYATHTDRNLLQEAQIAVMYLDRYTKPKRSGYTGMLSSAGMGVCVM